MVDHLNKSNDGIVNNITETKMCEANYDDCDEALEPRCTSIVIDENDPLDENDLQMCLSSQLKAKEVTFSRQIRLFVYSFIIMHYLFQIAFNYVDNCEIFVNDEADPKTAIGDLNFTNERQFLYLASSINDDTHWKKCDEDSRSKRFQNNFFFLLSKFKSSMNIEFY